MARRICWEPVCLRCLSPMADANRRAAASGRAPLPPPPAAAAAAAPPSRTEVSIYRIAVEAAIDGGGGRRTAVVEGHRRLNRGASASRAWSASAPGPNRSAYRRSSYLDRRRQRSGLPCSFRLCGEAAEHCSTTATRAIIIKTPGVSPQSKGHACHTVCTLHVPATLTRDTFTIHSHDARLASAAVLRLLTSSSCLAFRAC